MNMDQTLTWIGSLFRSGTSYWPSAAGNKPQFIFLQMLYSGAASTSCLVLRIWECHALEHLLPSPMSGALLGEAQGVVSIAKCVLLKQGISVCRF